MLYRILHPECTIHYAATHEVSQLVKDDLVQRFGGSADIYSCSDTKFTIDLGGAVFQKDSPVSFQIDDFTYSLWAHQYLSVLSKLNTSIDKPREGDYIKIHGAWTTIAMPLSHAKQLRQLIKDNSASLAAAEGSFLSRFDSVMQNMRDKNLVATATRPKSEFDKN